MHGVVQLRSGFSCTVNRFLRGVATDSRYISPGDRNRITLKGPDNQSHTGHVQDIRDDAVLVRFSGSRPTEWILKSQLSDKDKPEILDLDKIVYEVKDPKMQKRMEKLTACEALQAVQREAAPKEDVAFVGLSGSTITVLKSRRLPWSSIMHRLKTHYDEKVENAKETDRTKACTGDGVNVVLDQSQLDCGYTDRIGFSGQQIYHEHVDQEFLDLVGRSVTSSTRILTLRSIPSYQFLVDILRRLMKMGIHLDTLVLKDSKLILGGFDGYIEIVDWPRHTTCTTVGKLPARILALQTVTLCNVLSGLMRGRNALLGLWRFGIAGMDVEFVITNDQIPLGDNGVESQSIIGCFERYCPELPAELDEEAQTEWARLTTWKQPFTHPSYTGPPHEDIKDLRKLLEWFEVGQKHFPPDANWTTVDLQTINTKKLRRLTWRAVATFFARAHLRMDEEYGADSRWDPQTRSWDYTDFE